MLRRKNCGKHPSTCDQDRTVNLVIFFLSRTSSGPSHAISNDSRALALAWRLNTRQTIIRKRSNRSRPARFHGSRTSETNNRKYRHTLRFAGEYISEMIANKAMDPNKCLYAPFQWIMLYFSSQLKHFLLHRSHHFYFFWKVPCLENTKLRWQASRITARHKTSDMPSVWG
jgi:hypothetical protein